MTGVVSHAKSNTIPDFTGTVTVFNSAGATQTALASAIVRPSDWNSAHLQAMTLGGNTAGASSVSGSNIGLAGGPNVTLSVNGSTVVVSAASQTVQTQNMVSLQGSTGAIVFSNSNNVTFGANASTITASASFSQTVQTQGSVQVQGSTGAVVFSNSNNVSFGGAGSTVTASASFNQTVQTQGSVAVQGSTGAISFSNSNGITFGFNASTITASHNGLTTAASSNHSHGNPTLALTNLSGTTASNSAGLTLSISAAAPGAGGGPAISANGSSINAGTVVFSNSNGISFGMNGSTITATVNPGAAAGIAAVQAGTQTATSGTVTFGNSNGISFGMSGSSQITASYTVPSTAGLLSAINASAGTTSNNLSALVFSNSNGLSFGLNGSTITGSYTQAAQTVQTQSNVQGISAGTQVGRTGDVVFANSNGVTFGMSGSSQVTASFSAPPAQTAQSIGVYASSQTFGQSSSSTVDARSLSIVGSGGVSVGMSAGSLMISGQTTVAQSVQTQGSVQLQGSTGALVFSNSNGISFGGNASAITASYTVPSTAGLISAINLSAGTTSQNLAAVTFSNGNGVSFGLNGSVVTASVAAAGGAQTGISGLGNSETTFSSGTVGLSALGALTIRSTTGQQLQFSVNPQSTQPGIQTLAFGNTTFTTGAVSFSNANGISFGSSAGGAVTASYSVPSTAGLLSAVNLSAGTTSNNLSALVFSNSNGVTFGLNGSTVTASHNALTTARASTDAVGLNTAQSNVTWSVNSSGISLDARGYAGTASTFNGTNVSGSITQNSAGLRLDLSVAAPGGGGGVGISAGTQSVSTGTMVFSNSNNVSFGMSGSSRITASFSQSNQSIGIFASSNTTGQSSSGTIDARSLTVVGYGIVSVGVSNGSLQISTPDPVTFTQLSVGMSTGGNTSGNTGLATGQLVLAGIGNLTLSGSTNGGSITISVSGGSAAPSPVNVSAGTTSGNLGSIVFSNSNGVSFGLNGSTITASAAGGGGGGIALGNSQTTFTSGTVALSGAGAITIGSTTGQSLQLSVPQTSSLVGVAPMSISTAGSTISVLYNPVQASFFQAVPDGVTGAMQNGNGTVRVYPFVRENPFSASRADILASVSVSSSSNSSHAGALSVYMGIYTLNGSTLSLASSGSQSYQWTNTSNNSLASIASLRRLSVPMNVNFPGGADLFMGVMTRSSTTNANWFTASNVGVQMGHTAQLVGLPGEASSNTRQLLPGEGYYSATSSVMPSSMALSHLTGAGFNGSATHYVPNVYFANRTA